MKKAGCVVLLLLMMVVSCAFARAEVTFLRPANVDDLIYVPGDTFILWWAGLHTPGYMTILHEETDENGNPIVVFESPLEAESEDIKLRSNLFCEEVLYTAVIEHGEGVAVGTFRIQFDADPRVDFYIVATDDMTGRKKLIVDGMNELMEDINRNGGFGRASSIRKHFFELNDSDTLLNQQVLAINMNYAPIRFGNLDTLMEYLDMMLTMDHKVYVDNVDEAGNVKDGLHVPYSPVIGEQLELVGEELDYGNVRFKGLQSWKIDNYLDVMAFMLIDRETGKPMENAVYLLTRIALSNGTIQAVIITDQERVAQFLKTLHLEMNEVIATQNAGSGWIPDEVSGWVRVTGEGTVNVRQYNHTDCGVVARLKAGDTVIYLKQEKNGWYKIQLEDGTVGYISGKRGEVLDAEETARLDVEQQAQGDAQDNAQNDTKHAPEVDNAPQTVRVVRIPEGGTVNIRRYNDGDSQRIGRASPGETYELLREEKNGWYKIRLADGTVGYVSGRATELVDAPVNTPETPEEPEMPEGPETPDENVQEPSAEEPTEQETPEDRPTIRVVRIPEDGNIINIREYNRTDSKRVGRAAPGETYELLREEKNGWYKIRLADGTVGYVSSSRTELVDMPVNEHGTPAHNPTPEKAGAPDHNPPIIPMPEQPHEHDWQRVLVGETMHPETLDVHKVTRTYRVYCDCGAEGEQETTEGFKPHDYTYFGIQALHEAQGHARFKRCNCGAAELTGTFAALSSCSLCNVSSGITPVPGMTSAPGVTPVPGTTSAPGVTPVLGTTSAPGVTPVPGTTSAPGVTPVTGTTSMPGCRLYGQHRWGIAYEIDHPHAAYYTCPCGEEMTMPYKLYGRVFSCCECVGHDWSTYYHEGYTIRNCMRCGEHEEERTATAEAWQDYVDLMDSTREEAQDYIDALELDVTASALWRVIAMQATDKLTDGAFVFGTAYLDALENPMGTVFGANDKIITRESMDAQAVELWKGLIVEMLSSDARAQLDTGVDMTAYSTSKAVYDMMDLNFDDLLGGNTWKGLTATSEEGVSIAQSYADNLNNMLIDLRTKQRIITEHLGVTSDVNYSSKLHDAATAKIEANEIVQKLDEANKNLAANKTTSNVIKAIPWVFAAIESICEGEEAKQQVAQAREAYIELSYNYAYNCRALNSIIDDAEQMDNALLADAAQQVLNEIEEEHQEYLENSVGMLVELWNGIDDEMEKQGAFWSEAGSKFVESGANILATKALDAATKAAVTKVATKFPNLAGKAGGSYMAYVSLGATAIKALSNHDQVFVSAEELMALSNMSSSIDIADILKSEDDTDYTFTLWAQLQAKGCDHALDFIVQHQDKGLNNVRLKELGLAPEDREIVNNMLREEKRQYQTFINDRVGEYVK